MSVDLHLLHYNHPRRLEENFVILQQQRHILPGGPVFELRRLTSRYKNLAVDEAGMLIYHTSPAGNDYLEIRLCINNNKFCEAPVCKQCDTSIKECVDQTDTTDVFSFFYRAEVLQNFQQTSKQQTEKEQILAFTYTKSIKRLFNICLKKRTILQQLLNHRYEGALQQIFLLAKSQELLLYSLECLEEQKVEVFSCKFLADQEGRNRIYKAKDILLENLGEPITIKELSRKIAMNECYLKKGFKEIYGTTIFEFYQQKRMQYAHNLLQEKGCSVTEVSVLLGYSSISHFSAAFKKHTGIKPCELLR